jgi:hypothetical protein
MLSPLRLGADKNRIQPHLHDGGPNISLHKQRSLMKKHDSWIRRWIVFRVLGLVLDIGLVVATAVGGENSIRNGAIIAAVRNIRSLFKGNADLAS